MSFGTTSPICNTITAINARPTTTTQMVVIGQTIIKETQIKLLRRFEGPYRVESQLDNVTYRLKKEEKIIVAHVQIMLRYYEWEQVVVLNRS